MKRVSFLIASVVLLSSPVYALLITPGYNANATDELAARARNFSENTTQHSHDGGELYVGVNGLGTAGNRTEANYDYNGSWVLSPSENLFTFTYDKLNDKLIADATGTIALHTEFLNVSSRIPNPQNINRLNIMHIEVVSRNNDNAWVEFRDVTLNSISLGSFRAQDNQGLDWAVTGYNFSNGFVLQGKIVLSNALFSTSQEASRVEVKVGYVPEPATMLMLAWGLLGLHRRRRR